MSGLTVARLGAFVAALHAGMPEIEQRLNAADAVLGDGDTGSMLARVVETLAALDLSASRDIGAAFSAQAMAASSATGSSLGTLIVTALMAMAKTGKGRQEIAWCELGNLLGGARDAMIARGGASLGDKTVLDSLDAIVAAVGGLTDPHEIGRRARDAAATALTEFRPRQCRVGRARMFADRSRGIDDPGMLALALLTAMPAQAEQAGA